MLTMLIRSLQSNTGIYTEGGLKELQQVSCLVSQKCNRLYSSYNKSKLKSKFKTEDFVCGEALFGIHPVLLALSARKRKVHRIFLRDLLATSSKKPFVQEVMEAANKLDVSVQLCSKNSLDALSQSRPHQGICMDVEKLRYEELDRIDDHSSGKRLWVLLDSIQDPMNFGAVIRSAYYFGVDRLLAVEKNSCGLTPVVSKASSGAMEITPVYAVPDQAEFLQEYSKKGWNIIGTVGREKTASKPGSRIITLSDLTLDANTILVMGNEGNGMASTTKSLCHSHLTIPSSPQLHPLVDSLNVSVAAGVIFHKFNELRTHS